MSHLVSRSFSWENEGLDRAHQNQHSAEPIKTRISIGKTRMSHIMSHRFPWENENSTFIVAPNCRTFLAPKNGPEKMCFVEE